MCSGGERGDEGSRVAHSEDPGNAGGGNKGVSGGGLALGVMEENTRVNKVKVSFRDKLVGTNEARVLKLAADLSGDRLATITNREQGKHFSYRAMVHKLRSVWRLNGGYEVLDVGFDYFLVKFDLQAVREILWFNYGVDTNLRH
ncbi:hypothetical protein PIB30_060439 [Stylosanthes scabra]|uniref:DUF4283 domain-containing protein n=1 Tax=Stylosanthes scabra TaxID=79078 RepID=A0ABU6VIY7_9FABA|nr:hypothetical protein [Stylosanthes scabra]